MSAREVRIHTAFADATTAVQKARVVELEETIARDFERKEVAKAAYRLVELLQHRHARGWIGARGPSPVGGREAKG